jgi:hypothetical protein
MVLAGRLPTRMILFFVLVFAALAGASTLVSLPWSDEGWFANPALNLITDGSFGTSVLDPTASFRTNNLTGINQHTYWIVPLYPLAQAAWYKVVGFGLLRLRVLSVLFGLLALGAWWKIVETLTADRRAATVALGLLSIDFTVVWASSVGRMDIMAAALGGCGLAAYLMLREGPLWRAVLVSQTLIAAAGMSHPMAVGYFVGLLFLTLHLDRGRIRWTDAAVACVPYVVGAAAWGIYISQDFPTFLLQFGGNAADRGLHLNDPMSIIRAQIYTRYLGIFGMAADTTGLSHLKILILAAYAAGVAGALFEPRIRRDPGRRTLLLLAAAILVPMMLIDREAQQVYLIHFVLWLASITAITATLWWDTRPTWRWMLVACAAVVVFVQVSTTAKRVQRAAYAREYLPVAAYLKQHAAGHGFVFGSTEFAFELGFHGPLVDDSRLGFRSGKRPDFIVLDKNRYQEWIPQYETREPATYRYIRDMMDHQFHFVMDTGAYKLYARNGLE